MPKKLAVYIGRFSPGHNGHKEVTAFGQKNFDHMLVLIGSSDQSRRLRNPFTADERSFMMKMITNSNDGCATTIKQIRDYLYNDPKWEEQVQEKVNDTITELGWNKDTEVYLVGADRDETTKYLHKFPQYKQALTEENRSVSLHLSATAVREIYFGNTWNGRDLTWKEAEILFSTFIPATTQKFMNEFRNTEAFSDLVKEHQKFIENRDGHKSPSGHSYKWVTSDAVVIQTGHVLVVKRRSYPGKGQLALPGGHCEDDLRLFENTLKELNEETAIKVPEKVIRSSMKVKDFYDDVYRSDRGRTFTAAYLFLLPDHMIDGKIVMPKVRADGVETEKAFWMELAEVKKNPTLFFEDHYHIIEDLVSRIPKEAMQ